MNYECLRMRLLKKYESERKEGKMAKERESAQKKLTKRRNLHAKITLPRS